MAVQIPAEIESPFEAFAQRTGESTDNLVREALLTYLDDLEDIAAAKEHLLHPGDTISLDELKRNLGLDDSAHAPLGART
jgi:predicted DNA-binding protein